MSEPSGQPALGFIGIGVMGNAMATQLAGAGHPLTIFDVDARPTKALAARFDNVRVATAPFEVARDAEIVLTMLPSGREVREVVLGENGLIEALRPGALLIDCSSSEPWITLDLGPQLAERGVAMVDAPVSGGAVAADAADLVFMIGGEREHVARAQTVLQAIGQRMHHLGPLGSGHIMKSISNTITAAILVATGEGLLAGKALGLDPEAMTQVLKESTAYSWISRTHIERCILSRSFDEAFQLDLMVKDIGIAAGLVGETGLSLPIWAASEAVWRAAQAAMPAGSTVSHVVRHMELQSGIDITPGPSARG
jgi:3-hydroxyisobutyrate dehydrogenase-like beta-hydroxyacid dehydrogenase